MYSYRDVRALYYKSFDLFYVINLYIYICIIVATDLCYKGKKTNGTISILFQVAPATVANKEEVVVAKIRGTSRTNENPHSRTLCNSRCNRW